MRVALLSPIDTSLYSTLLACKIVASPKLELVTVLVRSPWNRKRIRSELARDGVRLILKVRDRYVLRVEKLADETGPTLLSLAKEMGVAPGRLSEFCRQEKIPFQTVEDHNASNAIASLRAAKPDVIAFTGGGLIRREVLEIPTAGVLNCHMGVLPRYRGMDVVEWPILEDPNDPLLGLTTHFMDQGIDTGPILLQRRFQLQPGETFPPLRRRMEREMVLLAHETLEGLAAGSVSPRSQRPEEGRQYFVLHPRLARVAAQRLKS